MGSQKAQLLKFISELNQRSDFYKNKWKSLGKETPLSEYPFTTKNELLESQQHTPPFGKMLSVSDEKIQRVHQTSGTTRRPLIIPMTKMDIKDTVQIGTSAFQLAGVTNKDRVVHCLNYCMWMGGYTDHQSIESTGATVIPFGVGQSEKLLQTIIDLKINAIHCTPSYLSKLEWLLQEKFNMHPKELPLNLGLFGGEAGISHPENRAYIESHWGIKAMNANYGLADIFSLFASEGPEQDGLHFLGTPFLYPELIDQNGKVIPLEPEAKGELVLSHLKREALPLVRYRTGDLIRIKQKKEQDWTFEILDRVDDMIVIGGINIYPGLVEQVLMKKLGKLCEYRIIVKDPEPYGTCTIQFEYKALPTQSFIEELTNEFKMQLQVTPKLEILEYGKLPRAEGKSKRVIKETACMN